MLGGANSTLSGSVDSGLNLAADTPRSRSQSKSRRHSRKRTLTPEERVALERQTSPEVEIKLNTEDVGPRVVKASDYDLMLLKTYQTSMC